MSESHAEGPIDDAAPGDLLALDRGTGEQAYKLVHKQSTGSDFVITLEGDDGETFQLEMAAGTPIKRSLESKWESAQSRTDRPE